MDNHKDKKRFAQIMLAVADNCRDSITSEGIRMRFSMLRDYSIEQIERAAWEIMARWKYTKMPTIAEFFDTLGSSAPKMEKVALTEATAIIDHIRRHGAAVFPKIEDPITEHIMKTRWQYSRWAARINESELTWWVKEFCEAYLAFSETRPDLTMLDQTPGPVRRLLDDIGNIK